MNRPLVAGLDPFVLLTVMPGWPVPAGQLGTSIWVSLVTVHAAGQLSVVLPTLTVAALVTVEKLEPLILTS